MWVQGQKAPMRRGHEGDRSWSCLFGWAKAELLTLKPRGLPAFRVEFLTSRPGTHLLWHENLRFPGITQTS